MNRAVRLLYRPSVGGDAPVNFGRGKIECPNNYKLIGNQVSLTSYFKKEFTGGLWEFDFGDDI